MQGFGEGRWLLAVSADLLAGIGRAAQMKMPREPGHVHGRLLPNHPRHGHLPRVAPRQLLQGGLSPPGDSRPFGLQPPGYLFPVRAPFLARPGAAMARFLQHRRPDLGEAIRDGSFVLASLLLAACRAFFPRFMGWRVERRCPPASRLAGRCAQTLARRPVESPKRSRVFSPRRSAMLRKRLVTGWGP